MSFCTLYFLGSGRRPSLYTFQTDWLSDWLIDWLIKSQKKFESLYYSQHCKLEQAHCRIVCNSAWQSIVKINQSETNCDQLKDDDGLCGHKDPQRLEHLSKESCLQIKIELRKSAKGVATTEVDEQLRGCRPLAQVVDHCTLCTLACPSKRLELICTTRKVNNMGQLPQISQWQGFAQVIDHCTLCTLSCPSKRLKLNCTTRKVNDMGQLPQILVRYDIRIGTIGYTNRYNTIWYIQFTYSKSEGSHLIE